MKVKHLVLRLLQENQESEIGYETSGSKRFFNPDISIDECLVLDKDEYSECENFGLMPITDNDKLVVNKVLIFK